MAVNVEFNANDLRTIADHVAKEKAAQAKREPLVQKVVDHIIGEAANAAKQGETTKTVYVREFLLTINEKVAKDVKTVLTDRGFAVRFISYDEVNLSW